MTALLSVDSLPAGFMYPSEFIRVVELGLTDLEPWQVLQDEQLRHRFRGLAERYPDRSLVPFAARQDNDDVACWEPAIDPTAIVIVHDYASPGWESRGRRQFMNFNTWFRQAIEDLIEFG